MKPREGASQERPEPGRASFRRERATVVRNWRFDLLGAQSRWPSVRRVPDLLPLPPS
jgi:hypothetical protein